MRLSEPEFELLKKFGNVKVISEIGGKPKTKKSSRVNSNKTIVDDIEFDSQIEAVIYCELRDDPNIEIIKLQPEFILQEKFKRFGKTYQPIKFTPDFHIKENGVEWIIEVKSKGTLYANSKSYPMRRKLFLKNNPGLRYREIIFDKKERILKEY